MADDPEGTLLLEGQVIDQGDVPVGGAIVRIDANPPKEVTTEADGSFALEDLVGRTYTITAAAGDEIGGPVEHELTDESDPVIVRMRDGAAVRVAVQDEAENPIEGAGVSVRGSIDRSGETGADGLALVQGVSPGHAVVTAEGDGYGPAREALYVPTHAGAEPSVTLTLREGAPIRGRVHTASGDPVRGARVVAEDASAMFSLADPDRDGVVTGADGRYEIPATPAGNVRVTARHERHPTASSGLVATDGRTPVTGVDIELAAGATVSGLVVDEGGAPAPWASVRAASARPAHSGRGGARGATAGEDGRFEIVGLNRGRAQLVATKGGVASAVTDVDLRRTQRKDDVELVLAAPARIAGHVVDGAGNPVPEVVVHAQPSLQEDGASAMELRESGQTTTDGGGRFVVDGLPEGTYRVRPARSAPSWSHRGSQGQLASTGDEDVTLTLEQGGTIAGRVAFEDGGAPAAFSVAVGEWLGTPFTGEGGGAFEIEDLEPGSYAIDIRGPTFSRKTLRGVEVESGETTDLGSVTLARGRGVSGRVVDASGAPVADATVVMGSQLFGDGKSLTAGLDAYADQMGIRRASTDDRGNYEFVGIGAHRQTIAAEHGELGRSPAAAIPAAGGSVDLDLELVPFGSVRGRATVGGEPRQGISIMASGKTDAEQHVMVTAAGDGSFVIDRLAAGEQRITASLGGGMGGQMASRDVEVAPGDEVSVDIDIEEGDIDLDIEVDTDDGSALAGAQLFLIEGRASAETGADLSRMFRDGGGDGSMAMGFALGSNPASFDGVISGAYSVCVLPFAGDLEDPNEMRELQERADELPVHCREREVPATPAAQSLRLEVPAPPPLERDDPETAHAP